MSETETPDAALAEALARSATLEARLAELEATTRARLIDSGLRAAASQAGMVDPDGLKLLDTSTVSLDEQGGLLGADALMAAARQARPWLFRPTHTAPTTQPPPPLAPRHKPATEMTHAEWQAARRALLRRV